MKPYQILQGTSRAMEDFENRVSEALELGYSLAGRLIAKYHGADLHFFQPVILEEDLEDELWDEEDDES